MWKYFNLKEKSLLTTEEDPSQAFSLGELKHAKLHAALTLKKYFFFKDFSVDTLYIEILITCFV